MRWFQVGHKHDGMKAKVWADSTPDSPERGDPPTIGYISCPEEDAMPLLVVGKEYHHFAEWYEVELIRKE